MGKNQHAFPLAMAAPGERVRIVFVRSGANLQERLLSMGLNIDDVITVEHSQGRGAVVVSKDKNRYGLGGGMAQKIFVERSRKWKGLWQSCPLAAQEG